MRCRRGWHLLLCGVAAAGMAAPSRGQDASADRGARPPAFEVASVKPNVSGDLAIRMDLPAPDRFTATNVPLRELIRFAYDVESARLLGGPDWVRSERFDVLARSDRTLPPWGPSGPPIDVLQMLRTLLTERFGLVVHRETRELPVYALVLARSDRRLGPGIRPSTLGCGSEVATEKSAPPPTRIDAAQPTCGMRIAPGRMVMGGTPMSQFATILAPFVQRVVIDRTGLDGAFDLQLSWTPERIPQGPAPAGAPLLPPIDPDGASIFASLREQLGLELAAQEAPLEVVIIDRVDRPTPD